MEKEMVIVKDYLDAKALPGEKPLNERSATDSCITLTDYLTQLIREDEPETVNSSNETEQADQQFDEFFLAICRAEDEPGKTISEVAKSFD
jgi:hypothetical protein